MLDEARVAELKAQYGDVVVVEEEGADGAGGMSLVFRVPDGKNFGRFMQKVSQNAHLAMTQFVFDLLVFPERAVLEAEIARRPGLVVALGTTLQKETGMGADFSARRC